MFSKCAPSLPCGFTLLFCIGIYEKFANAFSKAVQDMQVGDGFSDGVVQVGYLMYQISWLSCCNPNCIICF